MSEDNLTAKDFLHKDDDETQQDDWIKKEKQGTTIEISEYLINVIPGTMADKFDEIQGSLKDLAMEAKPENMDSDSYSEKKDNFLIDVDSTQRLLEEGDYSQEKINDLVHLFRSLDTFLSTMPHPQNFANLQDLRSTLGDVIELFYFYTALRSISNDGPNSTKYIINMHINYKPYYNTIYNIILSKNLLDPVNPKEDFKIRFIDALVNNKIRFKSDKELQGIVPPKYLDDIKMLAQNGYEEDLVIPPGMSGRFLRDILVAPDKESEEEKIFEELIFLANLVQFLDHPYPDYQIEYYHAFVANKTN